MITSCKGLLGLLLMVSVGSVSLAYKYPFQDPSLPVDIRTEDLINRLTLDEAQKQTQTGAPGIPRLGIEPYWYTTECLRGQKSANSTAFPQALGLAASFSGPLLYNVSEAVAVEVRGHYNTYRKLGNASENHSGVSCFSPVINIARHPLWGRNQETYGECPYLSGTLADWFVRGLQGNNPRYVRANAGCKHLDVHGGPEDIPSSRFSFAAKVSTRDWRMTFLPAFKKCVEAGAYSMMCSYNSINGVPACGNQQLLTNISRVEWGFKGYIVSDDGAISNIRNQHHYTKTDIETCALAIKAGCNLELGSIDLLKQTDALAAGLLTAADIRNNVRPMMYTRIKLGEFDPPSMNPYSSIDMSVVQSPEHRAFAVKAAQMTFTLLKNDGNVLPLKETVQKLALVGPFGNVTDQLFGDYTSDILPQYTTTVLQGLSKLATSQVNYVSGCDSVNCNFYSEADRLDVKQAVTGSDLVIVALGTGQNVESEGLDRAYLDLPGHQLDLLQDAVFYANGAKLIVLLFNCGPLDVTWAKLNPSVHAMMECYFPAQATGEALYNTLMATSADAVPAGRLPMTWPADISQVPEMTNYTMAGRTYRYYNGAPLYPFGYGLSYTSFQYSDLVVSPPTITTGQNVNIKVTLKNTGDYDADEVVQVYMSWSNSSVPVPKLQLAGFSRQPIVKGGEINVDFTITSEQMAVWVDDTQGWGTLLGEMKVYVGGQQPNQRTAAPSNVLAATFKIKM